MIQTLSKQWRQLDLTVEQGIDLLSTLCAQKVSIHGKASFQTIPQPCDEVKTLLDALDITMPDAIPDRGVVVSTRKKLPENRVKQSKSQMLLIETLISTLELVRFRRTTARGCACSTSTSSRMESSIPPVSSISTL